MGQTVTFEEWLRHIRPGSRVLLINPPVYDVRYAWSRWNQPLGLLKLGRYLRQQSGLKCQVQLLDFMLPSSSGRVYSGERKPPVRKVGGCEYKMRVFGASLEATAAKLGEINAGWPPDHVVVWTLTSYWGESLFQLVPRLKTQMPQAAISIVGPFAVYEAQVATATHADFVVTQDVQLGEVVPAYDLYTTALALRWHEGKRPLFAGLSFFAEVDPLYVLKQIEAAYEEKIRSFVFFTDDLFVDAGQPLLEVLRQVRVREKWSVGFHGLCGIQPSKAPNSNIWIEMLRGGFREVHLEYDVDGTDLNVDAYLSARRALYRHLDSSEFTGFLMIGTPNDDLYRIIQHALNLLELTHSVIPKPYTWSPGSSEYATFRQRNRLEYLSPHLLPAIEEQRIARHEYRELYRLIAFLTDKRLGRSFDFFDASAVSQAFRSSLEKGAERLAE